ncbi:2397_t:CDS:2, partial [Ambispora leptoticha]
MSVQQFASKLQNIDKLARMTLAQICEQCDMFFQIMDEQLKNLAELEAYALSQ